MRVLVVARCKNGRYAPFITEQVDAVQKQGVECKYFGIAGKGVLGYVCHLPGLMRAIREFHPNLIHAHYGLSGLLSNYQRRVPVVTTYHGSDINDPRVFWLSKKAISRSWFNVFVSQKTLDIASPDKNYALIPCGVNLENYSIISKTEARMQMGLDLRKKYVLFAGAYDNPVKNAALAKNTVAMAPDVELLELKGYSRPQVAMLMQAVDALLLTSFMEGSPQVIKEAMACGCPVVSVDVGDISERVYGIEGCYVTKSDPQSLAEALRRALSFEGRTRGREAIIRDGLTNNQIALKLKGIYSKICRR